MRQIFPPEPEDPDAWWRLLELLHKKDQTLAKGRWSECERKILVIVLVDASIEAVGLGTDTDTPDEGGFDEICLATTRRSKHLAPSTCSPLFTPNSKATSRRATGDRSLTANPVGTDAAWIVI